MAIHKLHICQSEMEIGCLTNHRILKPKEVLAISKYTNPSILMRKLQKWNKRDPDPKFIIGPLHFAKPILALRSNWLDIPSAWVFSLWKEFSLCSYCSQFFDVGVVPGKMGDHSGRENVQLQNLEQNPFLVHHLHGQAKVFREYLALFLEVHVFFAHIAGGGRET